MKWYQTLKAEIFNLTKCAKIGYNSKGLRYKTSMQKVVSSGPITVCNSALNNWVLSNADSIHEQSHPGGKIEMPRQDNCFYTCKTSVQLSTNTPSATTVRIQLFYNVPLNTVSPLTIFLQFTLVENWSTIFCAWHKQYKQDTRGLNHSLESVSVISKPDNLRLLKQIIHSCCYFFALSMVLHR